MKTIKIVILSLAFVMLLTAAYGPSVSQADQQILDDLIVDGSACVGLDCNNDMEFGFSTFQLQENNTRIFFNDTSTTAAFPRNDWEIIANDSVNEGENYFGIADRGQGVSSFSGGGICVGGNNDGNDCGSPGADCNGSCNGGDLNGQPCFFGDSSPCLDGGGTCGFDSICSGGTFDGQPCNGFSCAERGGTCEGAGECVEPGAIIFKIEAGAPEDSLVIDNVGTVRVQELEVYGDINAGTVNGRDVDTDGAALDSHIGDMTNPHNVTLEQLGGATPASKAGIIPKSLFSGFPKRATVTFNTPFDGAYAVVLTPVMAREINFIKTNVMSKRADGFTVVVLGGINRLIEIDWMARAIGE